MSAFTIDDNTVSSENQVTVSNKQSYIGDPNAPLRILILGNSITRHNPRANIGWMHDWGMAASAEEKDFVHRLAKLLPEKGIHAYLMIRQASDWERTYMEPNPLDGFVKEKEFAPDLIVFRLGENVVRPTTDESKDAWAQATRELLDFIGGTHAKRLFTTCFWPSPERDVVIQRVAAENGRLVTLTDLGENDAMMAIGLFEHTGVAGHPGDEGMRVIAERIADAIEKMI